MVFQRQLALLDAIMDIFLQDNVPPDLSVLPFPLVVGVKDNVTNDNSTQVEWYSFQRS